MRKKEFLSVFICATLIFAQGCGSPAINGYRVSAHRPDSAGQILVLPFLDTRSFIDEKDPLGKDIAPKAREVFIEEMRKRDIFTKMVMAAPEEDRDSRSYTAADILQRGQDFNADTVISGQVFSFTEPRAASIPPRAGYFIRIYSVPERKFVYIGERYCAAGVPGAEGGREQQARLAANSILDGYLSKGVTPPRPVNVPQAKDNSQSILFIPYFERENPLNMTNRTGGGAVATGLYSMELAMLGKVQVLDYDGLGLDNAIMPGKEEAIALAHEAGADFVVRGQVVEFRRAQSVPSLWSAVVSISILAAQVLFAEVSGVDIATEVYRAEDGECIFARRDISHQKYVVSAEKTVRVLASTAAAQIASAMQNDKAKAAPLIDAITVPQTEQEIKEAAEKLSDSNTPTEKQNGES